MTLINRYSATCKVCDELIVPGGGIIRKKRGDSSWTAYHLDCALQAGLVWTVVKILAKHGTP